MQTAEIVWKGKPLSELHTPWKAEAAYILQKMGFLWHGIEDDYAGFFIDPPLFQFHFVLAAAAYYVEHGGLRSEFYARIEQGKENHKEVPDGFLPIVHDILWPISLGFGDEKYYQFTDEPEIRQIIGFLFPFIKALEQYFYLCGTNEYAKKLPIWHYITKEYSANVPPVEYFRNLRTEPDITIDELEKLIQQSANLS